MENIQKLTEKEFNTFIKAGPAVIDFYADWCNPCKIISPIMESLAKEKKNIKFGKVDVDKENELAQKFGVMSIPTIMFFKGGKEVEVVVGNLSKKELIDKIEENF